jgi:hypothetical protein
MHHPTLIALPLIAGALLAAKASVASPPGPSVCGVGLNEPLAQAEAAFALRRVGNEMFFDGQRSKVAVRWEGNVQRGKSCPEVRAAPPNEPSVVVSVAAGTGRIRSISHRPPQSDCRLAEEAVTAKLGQPATSNAELAEWHREPTYFVLLTKYSDADCWLAYVTTVRERAK